MKDKTTNGKCWDTGDVLSSCSQNDLLIVHNPPCTGFPTNTYMFTFHISKWLVCYLDPFNQGVLIKAYINRLQSYINTWLLIWAFSVMETRQGRCTAGGLVVGCRHKSTRQHFADLQSAISTTSSLLHRVGW